MVACIMMICLAADIPTPGVDWRKQVIALVARGDIAQAVELAETRRIPWLAPHLARGLAIPGHYLGWILTADHVVVYRPGPEPEAWVWALPDGFDRALTSVRTTLAQAHAPDKSDLALLRTALIDPLTAVLSGSETWVFAMDGPLSSVPFALLTDRVIVLAAGARSAALSAVRVEYARKRPPSLFAYARAAAGDPDALPAARAEIALAAAALDAPATLLSGEDAMDRLRRAAYDGTLSGARFVLFAAHASPDPSAPGVIRLELSDDAESRYAPVDTVHLQFNAELVVLSACETAVSGDSGIEGFAHAGVLAGVGMTLLTQWRIDDAASAQFVAALFRALAQGHPVPYALQRVQDEFRRGVHGEAYRHPVFWAGWQLWGG